MFVSLLLKTAAVCKKIGLSVDNPKKLKLNKNKITVKHYK